MSEYIIGSFNVHGMKGQSNQEVNKNYDNLAKIIRDEKFDIVALQEVHSEDALKYYLMRDLSNQWSYAINPSTIKSHNSTQEYAFLYRPKRFQLVDTPSIYTKYRIGSGVAGITDSDQLFRPPLVARFTPQGTIGGSNFEIRLINTHIVNSLKAAKENGINKKSLRISELKILAEEIYRMYSTYRDGNYLPAYTVLLGDYNLCLTSNNYRIEKSMRISENRTLLHVQSELTSLTDSLNSKAADGYYTNDYDHFSYDASYPEKMRLNDSRVEALGKYYGNRLFDYRREISDHVPIKLIINLRTH